MLTTIAVCSILLCKHKWFQLHALLCSNTKAVLQVQVTEANKLQRQAEAARELLADREAGLKGFCSFERNPMQAVTLDLVCNNLLIIDVACP